MALRRGIDLAASRKRPGRDLRRGNILGGDRLVHRQAPVWCGGAGVGAECLPCPFAGMTRIRFKGSPPGPQDEAGELSAPCLGLPSDWRHCRPVPSAEQALGHDIEIVGVQRHRRIEMGDLLSRVHARAVIVEIQVLSLGVVQERRCLGRRNRRRTGNKGDTRRPASVRRPGPGSPKRRSGPDRP